MHRAFCISIQFLQPLYHGRSDGGTPEWPPSPLRVFQAIVASSAARWNERTLLSLSRPALRWLENISAPLIKAADGVPSKVRCRLYVPDNVADKVAHSWSLGNSTKSVSAYRTEKDVYPTRLKGMAAVYYVFPVSAKDSEFEKYGERIIAAVRSITHLGWGIDMVAADARVMSEEEANALPGVRWEPTVSGNGGVALRTPIPGTLDDLCKRHTAFLNRLARDEHGNEFFNPVPPLSKYGMVEYRQGFEAASQPFSVFSILKPEGTDYRAFNTPRLTTVVAGMVRHALKRLAEEQRPFGWSDADIAAIVVGHTTETKGPGRRTDPNEPRFAYLPLPSIERRGNRGNHVGMVRRVMVVGRPGMTEQIAWVRRALSGADLIEEHTGEVVGLLSLLPKSDWVTRQYSESSSVWTTVTPVVVPGFDDHSGRKTDKLLRRALSQAGFSEDLTRYAELDWRDTGFLPGLELAREYRRPLNVKEAPVRHVLIRWRDSQGQAISVPGPFSIGSGRFRGLGLFTSMKE